MVITLGVIVSCNAHKKSNDQNNNDVIYGTPDFSIVNNPGTDFIPKFYPDTIYEGSLVIISIPYANKGDLYQGKSLNFQEEFGITGVPGSGFIVDWDVPNAITGQSPVVIYHQNDVKIYKQQVTVGAAGSYSFKLVIDPLNKFPETTKGNNESIVTINVLKFPTSGG